MRVLVVYGSERGGTAGLANMIGAAFTEVGWDAQVRPAAAVDALTEFDAVVIGGALYLNRWHRDARAFVRRHRSALTEMPVWLFSSGPLDDSARSGDIAPVPQVAALAARLEIKGHMTFGGRLEERPTGFVARRMARTMAGDWRDRTHVREWVHRIVADMPTPVEHRVPIDLRDAIPDQRTRTASRHRQ
jgi:menaquinone-dependent protoporphyrinogen oxidase